MSSSLALGNVQFYGHCRAGSAAVASCRRQESVLSCIAFGAAGVCVGFGGCVWVVEWNCRCFVAEECGAGVVDCAILVCTHFARETVEQQEYLLGAGHVSRKYSGSALVGCSGKIRFVWNLVFVDFGRVCELVL